MIQVLRELNFINENNMPQIKTRVARELGGGSENLYMTELLMKNVLEKLEPEEIVPIISVA
jgi:superfamily II RNA helicase